MTFKIVIAGLFILLLIATIASIIQLNSVGSNLIKFNKAIVNQQIQEAQQQQQDVTYGELSSAIRKRLMDNPVTELNVKFEK